MQRILHAGDLDTDDVLVMLEAVAPVDAVRGNMDTSGTVAALPDRVELRIEGVDIVMQHRPFGTPPDAASAAADLLIHGHTHEPCALREEGRLTLNPGAVFQPRGGHRASLALLRVEGVAVDIEFIELAL